MPKDLITERLKQAFGERSVINRDELFNFYRSYEPDLKESTFGWRIYSLKEKNILKAIGTGVYTLSVKPTFHPKLEPKLKDIAVKISRQFPTARHCIWNTRWLNDWMVHQPGRFLMLVEVEETITESAFFYLKDEGNKNVFLNPDDNLLEYYVYEQNESIIIKPLVTKAPIAKEKNIAIATVEKILVDLFIDRKLFAPYQGNELSHIYNNAYKEYALNITKMMAYAKRRTKEAELLQFITKNTRLAELLSE